MKVAIHSGSECCKPWQHISTIKDNCGSIALQQQLDLLVPLAIISRDKNFSSSCMEAWK